jgi:oxygen-independent coproporphyrinogen-3 oxidase
MMAPFSLYLHIPFCLHKCPYCDFNTYAVAQAPEEDYTSALLAELDYRAAEEAWNGRPIQTIYFGGGTPSLFSPRSFERIITFLARRFPIEPEVEITIEANPGTVHLDNLKGYRSTGINRISIGAQSFNAQMLRLLGRVHTVEQTERAVATAREAGFRSLSLDLIFALPGQGMADLKRELRDLMALRPDHISAYGLTIEKGTEFYSLYKKGRLKPAPDDRVAEMLREVRVTLAKNDFEQYEISNYAKLGKKARHNLAYWNGEDYLGVGAGAHSMLNCAHGERMRWSNAAIPNAYIEQACSHGKAESWCEQLKIKDVLFEFFFLELRKREGIRIPHFKAYFGATPLELFPGIIEVLGEKDFLIIENDCLRLTEKGLLVADSVIENFIPDVSVAKRLQQLQAKIIEFPVAARSAAQSSAPSSKMRLAVGD